MNFFRVVWLSCISLLAIPFISNAANEQSFYPPKLARSFIEKSYQGKQTKFLYQRMSLEFQKKQTYKEFKKLIKKRHLAGYGAKLKVNLISQAPLSNKEGLLYYLAEINAPFYSNRKSYVILEKVYVIRDQDQWALQAIPTQLIEVEKKQELNQNNLFKIFQVIKADRQKEVLAHSRKYSIVRSLREAQSLKAKKRYREALIAFEKVLLLDKKHHEALNGLSFCRQQIQNEQNNY